MRGGCTTPSLLAGKLPDLSLGPAEYYSMSYYLSRQPDATLRSDVLTPALYPSISAHTTGPVKLLEDWLSFQ